MRLSVTPAVSSGSATGNPRNKTALQPGCSLMDWVALMNSGKDLTGTGGRMLQVTHEELSKHGPDSKEPWIALQGLVYNITHYKRFHPGGIDELLRGAGKDATGLFNEVHPWVSFQSMLSKCLLGKLVGAPKSKPPPLKKSAPSLLLPPPPPNFPPIPTLKSDFYQTETHIVISIYMKKQVLKMDQVLVERIQDGVRILVFNFEEDFTECIYSLGTTKISEGPRVNVTPSGKVEVSLGKTSSGNIHLKSLKREPRFEDSDLRPWSLSEKRQETHDVYEFRFRPPESLLYFGVPLGHHVALSLNSIQKMYTPVAHKPDLIFIIKIYPGGALTPLIHDLKLGEEIQVGNPKGRFIPTPPEVNQQLRLFAAGSGITPMMPLIRFYLPLKTADIQLLYFNKTGADIIGRNQIQGWCENDHFQSVHILSQETPPAVQPPFLSGRISETLLKGLLGERNPCGEQVLLCGPSAFNREAFRLLTETFGYPQENVFKFGS